MTAPLLVICMGVSGSGKSTLGRELARVLNLPFLEADDFHSPENRACMAAGTGLTDAQREPWMDAVCQAVEHLQGDAVLAHSGLRAQHRQRLRTLGFQTVFLYLDLGPETASHRLQQRQAHFSDHRLVNSQFQALQEPVGEPDVWKLDAGHTAPEVLQAALGKLRQEGCLSG